MVTLNANFSQITLPNSDDFWPHRFCSTLLLIEQLEIAQNGLKLSFTKKPFFGSFWLFPVLQSKNHILTKVILGPSRFTKKPLIFFQAICILLPLFSLDQMLNFSRPDL